MSKSNSRVKLLSVSEHDIDYSGDTLCNSNVINNVYSTVDRSILCGIDPDINYMNTSCNLMNSAYYNETTFNNTFKRNTNLSMFHLNIRSVPLHFSELLAYLNVLDIEFNIIALSETAIYSTHALYSIPNYNVEMKYREK